MNVYTCNVFICHECMDMECSYVLNVYVMYIYCICNVYVCNVCNEEMYIMYKRFMCMYVKSANYILNVCHVYT